MATSAENFCGPAAICCGIIRGANAAPTNVPAGYVDYRDKEVMQALVTVGALVALADGHLENVERDELVGFVHRQDFAPTISKRGIADAFDSRVRQLEENYSRNQIVEALRPRMVYRGV